ncbi:ricin-type beta-trefoil lectin domain protein [Plantactinospora sp. KBS50]|uniref:ricin-type beta-trefoil lectin domain protein n=1 Tax=Plantactinospora sp. KBS50 TaxID=2024580 RepID=UPI000BAB2113|nr:ricin-type beta-trefoil lectin domain protein [Plantactinospora sp. KBS50]ASW55395.1 hypothetical protein CIK06_16315 [Plantactinospora sp. KBS50]
MAVPPVDHDERIHWTRAPQAALRAVLTSGRTRGYLAIAALLVTLLGIGAGAVLRAGSGRPGAAEEPLVGVPIPTGQEAALAQAADACPTLSVPRLAAQLMTASRFERDATTADGGRGVAGLTDELWTRWSPSPHADRLDPAANITALAHHMCDLVGAVRATGAKGDLWQLALAAHHSGLAALRGGDTIPSAAASYVETVRRYALWYATPGSDRQPPAIAAPPAGSTVPGTSGPTPTGPGGPDRDAPGGGARPPAGGPDAVAAGAPDSGGHPADSGGKTGTTGTQPAAAQAKPAASPSTRAAASPTPTGRLIRGYQGRCITVPGGTARDGVQLQMQSCTGGGGQRWSAGANGSLRALGMCMDLANASTADGTRIQLARCNGGWAQRLTVNKAHDLVNTEIGKCVDVRDWNTAAGALLQLWTCTGEENQKWFLG